jgi:hypothetical protein
VSDVFGGRGQDYTVTNDGVDKAGGILVICSTVAESEREWVQWLGRTARSDRRGQYAVILYEGADGPLKTLADKSKYAKGLSVSGVMRKYDEGLIRALLDARDVATRTKLEKDKDEIRTGMRLHELCDAFWSVRQDEDADGSEAEADEASEAVTPKAALLSPASPCQQHAGESPASPPPRSASRTPRTPGGVRSPNTPGGRSRRKPFDKAEWPALQDDAQSTLRAYLEKATQKGSTHATANAVAQAAVDLGTCPPRNLRPQLCANYPTRRRPCGFACGMENLSRALCRLELSSSRALLRALGRFKIIIVGSAAHARSSACDCSRRRDCRDCDNARVRERRT